MSFSLNMNVVIIRKASILCFIFNQSTKVKICLKLYFKGPKGDWDFRISDLVRNPNGTDI